MTATGEAAQRGTIPNRPWALAALCIVGLAAVAIRLLRLPTSFPVMMDALGWAYAVTFGVLALARLAALIGLWSLRAWGLYLYAAEFIFSLLLVLVLYPGVASALRIVAGSIVPVAIIATAFAYRRRLR